MSKKYKSDIIVADTVSRGFKELSCYMNNTKLKRAGIEMTYSNDQISEFIKCKTDPLYFINNYVYIVSLDSGLVPFDTYAYQDKMVLNAHKNKFNIFLLPRQMGKTTTIAGYLLWFAIFNDDKRIAILANKGDTSREILSRVKEAFEELPWYMKPGVVEYSKGSITLSNGTQLIATGTSSSSIRGKSINLLYLDEFAHIDNDVEFFASTYPVITSGKTTKVIITSTPNGLNLFYKLWTEAVEKRNKFKPLKVKWSAHPERDKRWMEETLSNIGEHRFRQEFECAFQGSSSTLISGVKLETMAYKDPIRVSEESYLKIYEEPDASGVYAAMVDTSEGVGRDYSVVSVVNISSKPYKQVAVYRNNRITPSVFTETVFRVIKLYNDAYTIVESNSIGKIVADTLQEVYAIDNMINTTTLRGDNEISDNFNASIGIKTTARTKSVGCATLKELIESDSLLIEDADTIEELNSFSKSGSSYKAEKNKTDDSVMTLVMFSWFTTQSYFAEITDHDIRKMIKDNHLLQAENEHSVFGFYNDGTVKEENRDAIELFG